MSGSRPPLAVVQQPSVDTRSDETDASVSTSNSEGWSRRSLRNYSANTDTSESTGSCSQTLPSPSEPASVPSGLPHSGAVARKRSSRTLQKAQRPSSIHDKASSSVLAFPHLGAPPPLADSHSRTTASLNIHLPTDNSSASASTNINANDSSSTPTVPLSSRPNLLRRRSPTKPSTLTAHGTSNFAVCAN
jgi:hypothetical protein